MLKVILLALTVALSACSSHPPVTPLAKDTNAMDEIKSTRGEINALQKSQGEAFAKDDFVQAKKHLAESEEMLNDGDDRSDVLEELEISQAYLRSAREKVTMRQTAIPDIYEARRRAISAGAMRHQKEELAKADRKLDDFIDDHVKDGTTANVQDREAILAMYMKVEEGALKKSYLGYSHTLIEKAKERDAKRYVPNILSQVEKAYADAAVFIVANRTDRDGMMMKKQELDRQSERLVRLLGTARATEVMSPEELALARERNDTRTEILGDALVATEMENQDLATTNQNLGKVNRELSSENANLAEKTSVLALYKEAEQTLGGEAEVYQQENSILIRMKGLSFPSGKAQISSKDTGVLNKLQNVIKAAGPSTVLVEGHTDSIGTEKLNKNISEQRAKAIADYLAKNPELSEDKFFTQGHGFEKPLATNRTPAGRAQNRRVDVVITPQ